MNIDSYNDNEYRSYVWETGNGDIGFSLIQDEITKESKAYISIVTKPLDHFCVEVRLLGVKFPLSVFEEIQQFMKQK